MERTVDYGHLTVRSSRGDVEDIALSRTSNGVGSDPGNEVVLAGRGIALFHCKLVFDDNGCELVDLGSSRGTLVNGERIDLRRLAGGDEFVVGDYTLIYRATLPRADEPPAPSAPEETEDEPLPGQGAYSRVSSSVLASSTPPEAVVRVLRGAGTSAPPRPASDTGLKLPMPPTRVTAEAEAEPVDLPSVGWALDADEIDGRSRGGSGRKPRPSTTSGGLPGPDVEKLPHVVVYDGLAPRKVPLDTDQATYIGTHVSCAITLPYNRRVFPQHASLTLEQGKWWLRKSLPAGQIWVNGGEYESAELYGGEILHVGDVRLQFRDPTRSEPTLAQRCAHRRKIPLHPPLMEAGRNPDLSLPLVHPQVAERHARFEGASRAWSVVDQGTQGGTRVNGRAVSKAELQLSDVVSIGPFHFRYDGNNLEQLVAPGQTALIVHEATPGVQGNEARAAVSMVVYPRELMAIVHPPNGNAVGLLRLMCGMVPLAGGFVSLNSLAVASPDGNPPYGVGFVSRSAPLPPHDSVWTLLQQAISLGSSEDTPPREIPPRAEHLVTLLDLGGVRNRRAAALTPAQAIRLRIAMQLASAPLVLALDDPCRDLDASAASSLVQMLRDIADRGTPVVFTTPASRTILWCDEVALLAAEDQVAFYGPPDHALQYFGTPAFLDVSVRLGEDKSPGAWAHEFRASSAFAHVERRLDEAVQLLGGDPPGRFRTVPWRVSFARRFQTDLARAWRGVFHSPAALAVAVGQALLAGAGLSLVAPLGDTIGASLGETVAPFWLVLMAVVWTWGCLEGLRWQDLDPPGERPVSRDGTWPVLLSQLSTSAGVLVLQVLILMGLLRVSLPFHPIEGIAMSVILLLLSAVGFGGGSLVGRWLRGPFPVTLGVAWMLGFQATFSGSLGALEGLAAVIAAVNPMHWSIALVRSLYDSGASVAQRAAMFGWLVLLTLASLVLAAVARSMPPPRVRR